MSYCRWSSDGFRSDVYVYEDCMGGWTTHVAWARRLEALNKFEMVPIKLIHAGDTFNDPTPGTCAERLLRLKELGYHVPQYVIDSLQEEQKNVGQD